MSALIVDRAYLDIDGEEIFCASIDEDIDDGTKEVDTMNRQQRSVGFSRGNVKFKFKAEVPMDVDQVIDLEEIKIKGQEFNAGIEYEGGKSVRFLMCRIEKLSIKSKTGDHTNYSIDCIALDRIS